MSEAILWHHASFVLDLDERPIPDDSVKLIALGILSDRVIGSYRGEPLSEQSGREEGAALSALGITAPQFADLRVEAVTMLNDLTGNAAPTLRLDAIAR